MIAEVLYKATATYISDLENKLKRGEQEYTNLSDKCNGLENLNRQFEADNESLNK